MTNGNPITFIEMGNASSKKPNRHRHDRREQSTEQRASNDSNESSDDILTDSVQKDDARNVAAIKKDLYETPELFVLNNMLMCVMFFENYQKEIQELARKRYDRDTEFISPDLLFQNVNRNVLYRPLHGPKKDTSETLVPMRLYVINDVVRVINSMESHSSNSRLPTVKMEESFRKGYVKLKETETQTSPPENTDIPEARSEPTPSTSRSSTESETYGYSTITDIKTPKPIDIIKGLEMYQNRPKIPPSCISYRKVKKTLTEEDLEDKEIENITDEDLYDVTSYINSKGFMRFFQNSVFPNGKGTNLGFQETEIRLAKSIPGKIFCGYTEEHKYTPCEVIPALSANWPHNLTVHFLMKAQTKSENRKSRYIFPSQRMISEMQCLNCVVVPKGYVRKKGEHRDSDLEWEVHFPQAEMYLETYMSHAQAKSFLYLLVLHKTYIDPDTSQLGLLVEHIRSFLLWECEANCMDWPEHRLGTKLITLIKALNGHIQRTDLRDYFIKDKNVFQNIPLKYLRHAQKRFHEILESPVMSFIKSLRNLRYTRGKYFYHPFDFDTLHEILVKPGVETTNPSLTSDLYIPPNMKKTKYVESDMHIRHVKEAKTRERILKKRQQEAAAEKANLKKVEDERRGSVDSVDLKWTCDKKFDVYKTKALLDFFINNFIEIAKKCSQISTTKQTKFYLKQARYLTTILTQSCSALKVEADEFLETINKLEDECNRRAVMNDESPQVVENGRVNFVLNKPPAVRDRDEELRSNESVPQANGVVKPRKSVMFAESH